MDRLNAVFQGGGVKGIALVGALKKMEEEQISFCSVAGTSAGSIVAALYAAGYSATQLKPPGPRHMGYFGIAEFTKVISSTGGFTTY